MTENDYVGRVESLVSWVFLFIFIFIFI